MELQLYAEMAGRTKVETATLSGWSSDLLHFAVGLGEETGELLGLIKKNLFYGPQRDSREKMAEELGDVMWYWTMLCTHLQFDPEEILEKNIEKLRKRHG